MRIKRLPYVLIAVFMPLMLLALSMLLRNQPTVRAATLGSDPTPEAVRLTEISEETGMIASLEAISGDCVYDEGYKVYLCPEAAPASIPQRDPTASRRTQEILQSGGSLLLIPDSTADRVMAFDATTGDLVNADFIPSDPTNLSTPKNAILSASGDSILVSDQADDVVQEYDMDGNYIGVFAPAGGPNTAILDNIIGIALRPNGNLLVTVTGGANQDSVAEFDTAGNYLGNFVANGSGGMDGPFDVFQRSADWLVGNINSDDINQHNLTTGAFIAELAAINNFPEQVSQASNNNVLVSNFTGTQEGIVELTPAGALVGVYDPTGLSTYRGVYELPNGHFLVSTGSGVHEIDRSANLIETKISVTGAQYIELLQPGDTDSRLVEIEPNNVYTQAMPLPSPGPIEVTGNITPNGDIDWFSIDANAGNLIFSAVRTGESPPTQQDSQLRVFAPDGTTLLEFDDDDGDDGGLGANLASVIAGLTLTDTNTYYLRVNEFQDNGLILPYRLFVHLHDPADMLLEVESNNTYTTANALPVSALVSGTIGVGGDDDWYAVPLQVGETLFTALDGDPGRPPNSGVDFNLRLYGPDGTSLIWLANDVGGNSPTNPPAEGGTYEVTTAGIYYVLVEGSSGSTVGDYLLSVGVIPAVNPPAPSITLNKTVGTDPNVCAATDEISVLPGTEVSYCYEVTNTGNVTFTLHDLVDSELGTILNGFNYSLSPGASTFLTATATIAVDTINVATWTAYNSGPTDVVTATNSATVTVILEPDIEVAPASLSSQQPPDMMVTEVLTISNVGTADLDWTINESPTAAAAPSSQPFFQQIEGPPAETANGLTAPAGTNTPLGNGPTITSTLAVSPPTIDGSIGGPEWSGAFNLNITLGGAPVIMYIMNDADTLYLAFDDQVDTTLDGFDQIGIYFDDEGGTPPILYDNAWTNPACGAANTGEGNFWLGNFAPDPNDQWRAWIIGPTACATQFGGTNVQIAYSIGSGHMQYETAIPLNGSSAMVAAPGQTLGFRVYTASTGATFTGRWPEPSTFNVPSTYGNLHLATGGCTPGDIPWASAAPASGTTPPGSDSPVNVTFDSTGLAAGDYTGSLCVASNDPDTPSVTVPLTLTVEALPQPIIALAKTVGTNPAVCAATDNITVPAGTEVTYCYKVTNTGPITVTTHDLVDSALGTLLTGYPYVLEPGASTFVTATATITASVVNIATWTAHTSSAMASDTDTASVTIETEYILYMAFVAKAPTSVATGNMVVAHHGWLSLFLSLPLLVISLGFRRRTDH